MKTVILTLTLVASVAAAGDRTFRAFYRAPAANATTFEGKKVVALVMTDDDSLRMSAEEALVRVLAGRKIQADAAWRVIPREELRNKDQAKSWFEKGNVEGVVVLRPIRLERKTTEYAPQWITSYTNSFWGYYGYGWAAATTFSPGGKVTDTYVAVEVAVYNVRKDTLLFGAVSEAENPKNMDAYMKDLVGDAVEQLKKASLINR